MLVAAGVTAERRVNRQYAQFIHATNSVTKGTSEADVRRALGKATLALEVESGSHFAQTECRQAGAKYVSGYRFEHRTWINRSAPEDWFIICLDDVRRVIETINLTIRF
jgi:hypothetical protein